MSISVELHINGAMAHADEASDGTFPSIEALILDIRNDCEEGVFDVADEFATILVIRHDDEACECDDLDINEDICQIISSHMISE